MGLLVGLLNLIPYLQVISIPPCIILMLVHSVETNSQPLINLLLLLAVFLVIQIFQDGFLVPKIMGKKMGLNAALILLSLSIFGMLFGAVGLIIALPITTMLISYYKRFVLKRVNEQHQRENGLSPETIEQLRI
jgi:predicted PurR-regulated permease PerM